MQQIKICLNYFKFESFPQIKFLTFEQNILLNNQICAHEKSKPLYTLI